MEDKIKVELANALNVETKDIMDYRQTDDGTYNVVLFSFQKYTGVEPVFAEPAAELDAVIIPENLRKTYQKPESVTKAQLVKLAKFLEVDVDPTRQRLSKREYVGLINNYKENN